MTSPIRYISPGKISDPMTTADINAYEAALKPLLTALRPWTAESAQELARHIEALSPKCAKPFQSFARILEVAPPQELTIVLHGILLSAPFLQQATHDVNRDAWNSFITFLESRAGSPADSPSGFQMGLGAATLTGDSPSASPAARYFSRLDKAGHKPGRAFLDTDQAPLLTRAQMSSEPGKLIARELATVDSRLGEDPARTHLLQLETSMIEIAGAATHDYIVADYQTRQYIFQGLVIAVEKYVKLGGRAAHDILSLFSEHIAGIHDLEKAFNAAMKETNQLSDPREKHARHQKWCDILTSQLDRRQRETVNLKDAKIACESITTLLNLATLAKGQAEAQLNA